jgi:hypothetical protein
VTLQNRVDPFGSIHAEAARGTLMGNRGGCMHTDDQRLRGRPWVNARWIACVLEFRGWHREVMQPRRYTELFFLDEATAFAAGHRPCFECRRADARLFAHAWAEANEHGEALQGIDALDRRLHEERIDPGTRKQRTTQAVLRELPDGSFVTLDDSPDTPRLLWRGRLWRWTFGGYARPLDAMGGLAGGRVTLLTPPSVVEAFRAGYRPAVHPTCEAGAGKS